MLRAVDLNHKLRREAGKVRDIRTDRHLSAKMGTLGFEPPEIAPQQGFGIRRVHAQTTRRRSPEAVDGASLLHASPHPAGFAGDPPPPGEGDGACGTRGAHHPLRSITIHPAASMRASKLAVTNVEVSSSAMIAGPATRTPAAMRSRRQSGTSIERPARPSKNERLPSGD